MSFPADRLRALRALEANHFWFVARRELLERTLEAALPERADVLEVGPGTGRLLGWLASKGRRCIAVDQHAAPDGPLPGVEWRLGDAVALPLGDATVDAVLLLDVLEHVDDRVALGEAARVLRPGGQLLVTVPALPLLWSFRDEAAGHLRRYTAATLRARLRESSFSIERLFGYQVSLLPLLVAHRLLAPHAAATREREDHPRPWLNRALVWWNRLDSRLSERLQVPFGSSLVVLARKAAA